MSNDVRHPQAAFSNQASLRSDAVTSKPTCATRLVLSEILSRFEGEAIRHSCNTGRYRCPYFVWGEGPQLIFIPGLCDDALSFVMPIARLSERFRCIAYGLPTGAGDGARLAGCRHGALVDDLITLANHLQLKQAYLFGSSFGSTIVLEALRRHPKRFPRAVLQGGFARRHLAPVEKLLAGFARYWPGTMARVPMRERLLKLSHEKPFAGREPEAWNFFLERFSTPPIAAVARRALIVKDVDLRPILKEITQPVLLICGDHDAVVGRRCEEELLRGLPRALRAEIENCGHMPQFTHPEVLAELVERFLGRHEADCGLS
ncbi:MAG: alpha/beta hydrolase [Planctomycetes bacterium]|nr:alpha/beta hydrolase [Planctomycetota bacterium]